MVLSKNITHYMDTCYMIYLPGKELKTSSNCVSIDAGLTVLKLTYSVSVYVYEYATMNIICLLFLKRAIFGNYHLYSSLHIVGNNDMIHCKVLINTQC